jgi:processive 1,2-diacylglycerol beta-glucosyltransferase
MKILVVHASAGAGHLKAAEALYHGLNKLPEDHELVLLDALDKASPSFKRLYRESYFFLISKIPWLWGIAFAILDLPWLQPFIRAFRRFYNAMNMGRFQNYLIDEQFDCVFSTHFMPNEIVSALKRKGLIHSRLVCTVTDFDIHHIWLADGVDRYSVASPWTKQKLTKMGVPEAMIVDAGIPTHAKFREHPGKAEIRDKLDIPEAPFTVLMATGSFGIGPMEEIVDAINGACQVIVICGHNLKLHGTLLKKGYEWLKPYGLVDNMEELMELADIMVTKPGGLSIAEALVKELPLIFFNPIPGQETNNIRVLRQSGVGISGLSIDDIAEEIKKFSASKEKWEEAVKKTSTLSRPNAVRDIIALRDA